MGSESLVIGLLIKTAEKIVAEMGKYSLKKLFSRSPLTRAIRSTAKDFSHIPVIKRSLKKWSKSDEFASLLEEVRAGRVKLTGENLADSFIRVGGFHDGINNSYRSASRVLGVFAQHLEKELYSSDEATWIEAQRATMRHKETVEAISQHHHEALAEFTEVDRELIERARDATLELAANTLTSRARRVLAERPQIALQAIRIDQKGQETREIFNLESIRTSLINGRRLLIEAPAGRGKTTTLVQLAKQDCSAGGLTFLVNLPAWIDSDQTILGFLEHRPEFQSRGINADLLAKLSRVLRFSFLLNGWNEVSKVNSDKANVRLSQFEQSFPKAGIIIATRIHHITPPLSEALRVRLLPLTRRQRAEYLQQSLESRADELISKLDNDPTLDGLTRTPLILSEVTTIFKEGRPIPTTKIGVLREVASLPERSEEHRNQLQGEPLMGHAQDYLTALAIQMTTRGETKISERDARAVINSASNRLMEAGQIATLPEPAWILSTLCAHHILERLDSQPVTFSFAHQQFQEFYVAGLLGHQLLELAKNDNRSQNREFVKQYVNEPGWGEPIRLVAEEIGMRSAESHAESDVIDVRAGKLLVEMALRVDPIFAAELSRLCGNSVWEQVRTVIGERLRSWYESDDEKHRQCAVAGMLASGSGEFSDIILPLLTSNDSQVRLRTYRAGSEFHLSSLGKEQLNLVREWSEEARIDFITELSFNRWIPPETVASFALTDPSLRVKLRAIQGLNWIGLNQDVVRLLEALDEKDFEAAVQELYVESIPVLLHPRALAVYKKLLDELADAKSRFQLLLRAAKAGDTGVAEKLKQELTELEPSKIASVGEFVIEAVLEIVQRADPEWVSHWVAYRIVDGSLWSRRWIVLVTCIPEDLRERLLEKISSEDFQHRESEIISVLAATGDSAFAEAAFTKLCEVRGSISDEGYIRNESRWAIVRQLENLFRALPPNVALAGLAKCFASEVNVIELTAMIEVFGQFGNDGADLRNLLRDDLRQNLRRYLKNGVPFVFTQEDAQGGMKSRLATALARVGDPDDMLDLHQLIRADIDRIRRGLAARKRGERSALAMGCANVQDNVHVRAVARLDPGGAEGVLIELLHEPEYEGEAASALLRLATIKDTAERFIHKTDYGVVLQARNGHPPKQFDEERRRRYTAAIRQRISTLMEERASSPQPTVYNFRLIDLAKLLAVLDSHNSAGLVLQVIEIDEQWKIFTRVEAIEALLFGGAELPTEVTLGVLSQIIECIRERSYDSQNDRLLTRCLCLLPFVNDPSVGIEKIRQVLSEKQLPFYELREVVAALGYSRSQDAVPLLRDLVGADGNDTARITEEWVKAVANLDGMESRRILLSLIDPDIGGIGIEVDAETASSDHLASHIAGLTRADPQIKQRVLQLSSLRLSSNRRALISKVLARLGTGDAILASLNLIDDAATPPVPFYLRESLETFFLDRKPYGETGSAYTVAPRSSIETNEIKMRLFEMVLNDGNRRRSASALLGQIEVWRLEYGRPDNESRHPAFDSGEDWPPRPNLERDQRPSLGYPAAPPEEAPVAGPQPEARDTSREQDARHEYDLFLSHASEDKDVIARPLYEALIAVDVSVWFDEAVLELGDSLRRKIDEGLAKCRYGVVILSPMFLSKEWPQRELDGLVARETASGEKAILPIWHEIDRETLLRYSPPLADRLAGRSEEGIPALVEKIRRVLRK